MAQISEDYVKHFNAEQVTDPARLALVIVDMQYATGHRTGALAHKMAAEGNSVTDWRAHQIIEELVPETCDPIVCKTSIGAFASTGLDHLLWSLDREHLFMTGVSTNMCVETTAREAAERGYAVTVLLWPTKRKCARSCWKIRPGVCRE